MFAGVKNYEQITTDGLLISFGEEKKDLQTLKVDSTLSVQDKFLKYL